jgi:hypothetical protein
MIPRFFARCLTKRYQNRSSVNCSTSIGQYFTLLNRNCLGSLWSELAYPFFNKTPVRDGSTGGYCAASPMSGVLLSVYRYTSSVSD